MDFEREIEPYFRSRVSPVCLVSVEEERLLRRLQPLGAIHLTLCRAA